MLNGYLCESFSPWRGLRQDDHLSPYLFVICVEDFSALLQKAEELNDISSIRVCRATPKASHLFFVDDALIFSKASLRDCEGIMEAIHNYGEAFKY